MSGDEQHVNTSHTVEESDDDVQEVVNMVSQETRDAVSQELTQSEAHFARVEAALDKAALYKEARDRALMPPPRTTGKEKGPSQKKRKAAGQKKRPSNKRLVNAKKLLITLSQCAEELPKVIEALEDKFGLFLYKIVHEKHLDGNLHVHGALSFDRIIQCRDNRLVINGKTYHINFTHLCKDKGGWKGWLEYLEKDKVAEINTLPQSKNLMGAENKEELFSLLSIEKGEYQAMMSWDRVYGCWVTFHKATFIWNQVFPLDSFRVPPYLQGLKVELDGVTTRRKIVILIGETGLGKTQMVKTFYTKMGFGYCREIHNFHEWNQTSGPMILDDLEDGQPGSTTKPPKKAWTDSQPYNMTAKYTRVTAMKPRQVIILTNEQPEWLNKDVKGGTYWIRNCHVIKIEAKCWK